MANSLEIETPKLYLKREQKVEFDPEQARWAILGLKAQRYVEKVSKATPLPEEGQSSDETDELLQSLIQSYDEVESGTDKLLAAETLADTIIEMVIKRMLDARSLRGEATLEYRGEIFVLGSLDRRCADCNTRPIVFKDSGHCTVCHLN